MAKFLRSSLVIKSAKEKEDTLDNNVSFTVIEIKHPAVWVCVHVKACYAL